jgi:hypothetical protein
MKTQIQVVENSDRFHVSENNVPVHTFLFAVDGGIGVSKAFAQMNANAVAYELAVKRTMEGFKIKLLKQQIK